MKVVTLKFEMATDLLLKDPGIKTLKEEKRTRGMQGKQLKQEIKKSKEKIKLNEKIIDHHTKVIKKLKGEIAHLESLSKGTAPRQIEPPSETPATAPTNLLDQSGPPEQDPAHDPPPTTSAKCSVSRGGGWRPLRWLKRAVTAIVSYCRAKLPQRQEQDTTAIIPATEVTPSTTPSILQDATETTSAVSDKALVVSTYIRTAKSTTAKDHDYGTTKILNSPMVPVGSIVQKMAAIKHRPKGDQEVQRVALQSLLALLETKSCNPMDSDDVQAVITAVVSNMKRFSKDLVIQTLGSTVLARLAALCVGDDRTNPQPILSVLQGTLQKHPDHSKALLATCDALQEWSKHHTSTHPLLKQYGTISKLLFAIGANKDDVQDELHLMVCKIFYNLTSNPHCPNKEVVVNAGLDLVLETMASSTTTNFHSSTHKAIQDMGTKFLSDSNSQQRWLSSQADDRNRSQEFMTAMLHSSRVLGANQSKQASVWMLLVKLVKSSAVMPTAEMIRNSVERALAALVEEQSVAFSLLLICRFLNGLLTRAEHVELATFYHEAMTEFDGIPAIVGSMKLHREDHHLQQEACLLLLEDDDDCTASPVIANVGGMEVIVDVLAKNAGKSHRLATAGLSIVMRWVCDETFINPADMKRFAGASLVPCLIATLKEHSSPVTKQPQVMDGGALEAACEALFDVCNLVGKEPMASIVSHGGVPCLLDALREAPKAQAHALRTLHKLMEYDTETFTRTVISEDGIPGIASTIRSNLFPNDNDGGYWDRWCSGWLGCCMLRQVLMACPVAYFLVLASPAIENTLHVMSNGLNDRLLQLECSLFLNRLMCFKTSPVFVGAREHCRSNNGLNIVVDAILKFPGDQEVDQIVGATFGYMINPPELGYALD